MASENKERIRLWPPDGGEPVTVFSQQAEHLLAAGWKRQAVKKPKAEKPVSEITTPQE